MPRIEIYTSALCGYCQSAKRLLDSKRAVYEEIRIDQLPGKREEMVARSRRRSVPQIFIGDTHVGGFDDLAELNRQGGLDPLLEQSA